MLLSVVVVVIVVVHFISRNNLKKRKIRRVCLCRKVSFSDESKVRLFAQFVRWVFPVGRELFTLNCRLCASCARTCDLLTHTHNIRQRTFAPPPSARAVHTVSERGPRRLAPGRLYCSCLFANGPMRARVCTLVRARELACAVHHVPTLSDKKLQSACSETRTCARGRAGLALIAKSTPSTLDFALETLHLAP